MFKYKGLKVRDGDASLPKTRKELFKTIVKDDFYLLAELSVLIFLFSLPLIAGVVWEILALMGSSDPNASILFSVAFYMGLFEIPLFGVRYIGRHAAFLVMKKRVHNESGYIKELFFEGLKKGALRGFLIGCVMGIVVFLWQIASIYVLAFNTNTWIKGLGIGTTTLFFLIAYAAVEYFLSLDNFYELGFGGALKNGFSFAIMHFPVSGLYFVVTMAVPAALILVAMLTAFPLWALIMLAAVFAFWGDGFTVLVVTLYSHALFDRYINSVYYTDYINKGLSKEESITEKEKNNG